MPCLGEEEGSQFSISRCGSLAWPKNAFDTDKVDTPYLPIKLFIKWELARRSKHEGKKGNYYPDSFPIRTFSLGGKIPCRWRWKEPKGFYWSCSINGDWHPADHTITASIRHKSSTAEATLFKVKIGGSFGANDGPVSAYGWMVQNLQLCLRKSTTEWQNPYENTIWVRTDQFSKNSLGYLRGKQVNLVCLQVNQRFRKDYHKLMNGETD